MRLLHAGQICSGIALIDGVRAGFPSAVTADVREPVSVRDALASDELRERMSGNICRCAAYNGIATALRESITNELGEPEETR